MSPFPMLISAGPLRRPTETSPARVVRRTLAASSSLIEPCEPSKVTLPNRPTPGIRRGRLRLDAGTAGQLDRHLDGSGAAEDLVLRRGLDPQDAVAVFDRGLLRLGQATLGHRIVVAADTSISSGQPSFSSRVIMARPNAVALVLPNQWRIRGTAG